MPGCKQGSLGLRRRFGIGLEEPLNRFSLLLGLLCVLCQPDAAWIPPNNAVGETSSPREVVNSLGCSLSFSGQRFSLFHKTGLHSFGFSTIIQRIVCSLHAAIANSKRFVFTGSLYPAVRLE